MQSWVFAETRKQAELCNIGLAQGLLLMQHRGAFVHALATSRISKIVHAKEAAASQQDDSLPWCLVAHECNEITRLRVDFRFESCK